MRKLFTREQYRQSLKETFFKDFPWIEGFIVEFAPGHEKAVRYLLSKLEILLGGLPVREKISVLFIHDAPDGKLNLSIGLADTSNKPLNEAVEMLVKRTQQIAKIHCPVCGTTISSLKSYCQLHTELRAHFADEQIDTMDIDLPRTEDSSDPSIHFPDDNEEPDDEEMFSDPMVQVFSPKDVDLVAKASRRRDGEQRNRLNALVEQLRSTERLKPLAVLPLDWEMSLAKMEENFPNFGEFFEFLRHHFTLCELGDRRISIPPVLFDGPPGIGKTELILSLAEMVNTEFIQIDMAAAQSGSALSGSEEFWSNSSEGRLFTALAFGKTANPIFFLDEIDKVNTDRYRPDASLYQLLEPRTARKFHDLSVPDITFDASHVIWFSASNKLTNIDEPILSRFAVFNIPEPSIDQGIQIAKSIYGRLRNENHWGSKMDETLFDDVSLELAKMPPRMMRSKLIQGCGRAAWNNRNYLIPEDILPENRKSFGFIGG